MNIISYQLFSFNFTKIASHMIFSEMRPDLSENDFLKKIHVYV